jgi:hypothetical protein
MLPFESLGWYILVCHSHLSCGKEIKTYDAGVASGFITFIHNFVVSGQIFEKLKRGHT